VTLRVPVDPGLLHWAMRRSGRTPEGLSAHFKKLSGWLTGQEQPTLNQLEEFARRTHTPIGYFFLTEPPEDELPIPDFRTLPQTQVRSPSVDLLETIYLCQQSQSWYRDYVRLQGDPGVSFVGTATLKDTPVEVAARIRERLGFDIGARSRMGNWSEALREFIRVVEESGILVMISGIVGSNTHRPLDVAEFRGFALADELAPLVFINGKDSKAAQMFTLAHELAHLWLGSSGVSNNEARSQPDVKTERWCNAVAAEILVPLEALEDVHDVPIGPGALSETLQKLSRRFRVSTLVLLRRLFDAGRIDRDTLDIAWQDELDRMARMAPTDSGGDFYNTLGAHVGKRLARAVITSTLEGQTSFTDAFHLLGVRKTQTFYKEAQRLGIYG